MSMATLKLNLIGHGFDLTEAIKSTLREKFDKLEKYLGNNENREVFGEVIVKKEKYRSSAEIVIYNVFDHTIRVKKESNDLYNAVDQVVDAVEKQLRRLKDKVKSRKPGIKASLIIEEETGEETPLEIIEVEPELYKPISVEDAAVKLLGSDREFVMFCNVETGNPAVLYKRADGNFGLIQMPSCR